jgi:hypothetical protein
MEGRNEGRQQVLDDRVEVCVLVIPAEYAGNYGTVKLALSSEGLSAHPMF